MKVRFFLIRLLTQFLSDFHEILKAISCIHLPFAIFPDNIIKKYCIVQKLEHLTCSKFTTLYKPINFILV